MNLAERTKTNQAPYTLAMKYFIDCEVILFILVVFIISFFLSRRRGTEVSIVRALEITSAAVLPLGFEIYYFDRSQFNIHATDIQVKLGLAWIT